jgi:DNA-binding CsgD family transcriptional regulator
LPHLDATQLRTLNRVLLSIHEDIVEPMPLESLIDLFETLFPISWISVDEARIGSNHAVHRGGRRLEVIPQLEEKIVRFCHQNPVVARVLEGNFDPALKVSDFTSFREFERTAFYHEIARFMPGWRDQAAVALRLPGKFVGFGLNRDRAFNEEELFMLELLQPHVERVLQRCTQYLALRTRMPLTPRECEILHWVSEGKRDSEIASIMNLSVRTVEQHVRACLRKLDFENRSAAVAEVWRARCQSIELAEKPGNGQAGQDDQSKL